MAVNERVQRIQEHVKILDLLAEYGYEVDPQMDREQQYRCDLHGIDGKPSARVYPQSNSTFCFACGKARDTVSFVMDREGVSFRDACRALEQRAGLPAWAYEQGTQTPVRNVVQEIEEISRATRTFEQEASRLDSLLTNITRDRELPMAAILALWEAYDRIMYGAEKEGWKEPVAIAALGKLRQRALGQEA